MISIALQFERRKMQWSKLCRKNIVGGWEAVVGAHSTARQTSPARVGKNTESEMTQCMDNNLNPFICVFQGTATRW